MVVRVLEVMMSYVHGVISLEYQDYGQVKRDDSKL